MDIARKTLTAAAHVALSGAGTFSSVRKAMRSNGALRASSFRLGGGLPSRNAPYSTAMKEAWGNPLCTALASPDVSITPPVAGSLKACSPAGHRNHVAVARHHRSRQNLQRKYRANAANRAVFDEGSAGLQIASFCCTSNIPPRRYATCNSGLAPVVCAMADSRDYGRKYTWRSDYDTFYHQQWCVMPRPTKPHPAAPDYLLIKT